jgi:hypothetical protein
MMRQSDRRLTGTASTGRFAAETQTLGARCWLPDHMMSHT